jgi:gliding motility-associated-like protein
MIKYFYILLLSLFPLLGFSQFTVDGSTTQETCNCFDITPNTASQTGSFNQNATIDLTGDFDYNFTVNFGCDGFGGEGIAFVMQSDAWTTGTDGAGLGYGGIVNSLAIEFDTRDNESAGENSFGDVASDHIAIQSNGVLNHGSANNLLGAFTTPTIINGSANAEDCMDHNVNIIWSAATFEIDIIVDGISSIGGPQNIGDIITNIFGGNSNVRWGWTGSTSVIPNNQKVCLALEPEITYTPTNCPGQIINFIGDANSFNPIVNYAWDFDGLGTSNLPNPSFTFNDAGNHPVTLTITDDTGCSNSKTFDVGIGFEVGITADDLTICPNSSTQLHVEAAPFVGNECCFELVLTDLFDDGWASNNVEVFVDGGSIGTFAPAIGGNGAAYSETFALCFSHDASIEIKINGAQFPGECKYELFDQSGNLVVGVNNGATWVNGDIQAFTVDCGITPPTYTYVWDNAAFVDDINSQNPTITIANSTTFTVEVTDPNTACTISESITINTYAPVTATISGNETVCQGSEGDLSIAFTGSGPYDIQVLDPNSNIITENGINSSPFNLSVGIDGNYTLLSVTGGGCSGTELGTGTINVVIPPSVDIESDATYCNLDPINALNVVSTNGGTVNWYTNPGLTGAPVFTGNSYTPTQGVGSVTYYAQEVEGVNNCGGPADDVTIIVYPIPSAPIISGISEYCEDETPTPLTAEMSAGGTASWYNNAALTPPTVSTLLQYNPTLNIGTACYFVTETANGCTGTASQICILTKPKPNAPVITGNLTYCEGETPTPLTATPTMAGDISWFNVANTNIANAVDYTPDISSGNQTFSAIETLDGCDSDPTFESITVNILPTVSIPENETICYGDSILIEAENNGFDLYWSNGDTTETSWLSPDTSGIIFIIADNPLCGITSDSIYIEVFELPNVVAGSDTIIGIGGEVTLWAEGTDNFTWTPTPEECITGDCSQIYVLPNQATVYVVDGVDGNQCHNYDTVLVDISGYQEVFVPNVFSPNGDGWNDYLEVRGPRLFDYKIQIFDRWGKLIFESIDQKDTWDGKFKGNDLAPQAFVYIIRGETLLGEKIKRTGNVTIIK